MRPIPTTIHTGLRAKVGDGKSVRVLAPAGAPGEQTLAANRLHLIDGFLGFGMADVDQLQEGVLTIEQAEYETNQIDPDPLMLYPRGTSVYWDDALQAITEDDAAGVNRYAGKITQPRDVNGVVWFILAPQV